MKQISFEEFKIKSAILESKNTIKSKYRKRINIERSNSLVILGFSNYNEYLKSSFWNEIKLNVYDKKGSICKCGQPAIEIHHIKYDIKTMSGKSYKNLIPVCQRCHSNYEKKKI